MTTNGNTSSPTTAPAVTFTEAPASLNLRFDYNGFKGIMLTLRASTGLDVLAKLDGALAKLDKMGATPAGGQGGERYAASAACPPADANAPMCPTHGNGVGKDMDRSKHFAGWYCPNKMQDGSYCKHTVKD